MKKYFWMMAVVLMAMAATLASCGGSDDDPVPAGPGSDTPDGGGGGSDSGLKPGETIGSGTFVVDGTTYTITEVTVSQTLPWGETSETSGWYDIFITGELESGPPMDFMITLAGDHINGTYNLTDNLNSSDGSYYTALFINGTDYYTDSPDFKSGTICVTLDASGNLSIETQGVANLNDSYEPTDPDVSFSLNYKGQTNLKRIYYAEPPHVPYGDGVFTGTSLLICNGVPQSVQSVTVTYYPGELGSYDVDFNLTGEIFFRISIPLDHLGATYNLTDDLTGAHNTWTDIQYDGMVYYTDEGDFKSGTVNVSLDAAGNLSVYTKGVANDTDDDADADFNFETSFTGKGTVMK